MAVMKKTIAKITWKARKEIYMSGKKKNYMKEDKALGLVASNVVISIPALSSLADFP